MNQIWLRTNFWGWARLPTPCTRRFPSLPPLCGAPLCDICGCRGRAMVVVWWWLAMATMVQWLVAMWRVRTTIYLRVQVSGLRPQRLLDLNVTYLTVTVDVTISVFCQFSTIQKPLLHLAKVKSSVELCKKGQTEKRGPFLTWYNCEEMMWGYLDFTTQPLRVSFCPTCSSYLKFTQTSLLRWWFIHNSNCRSSSCNTNLYWIMAQSSIALTCHSTAFKQIWLSASRVRGLKCWMYRHYYEQICDAFPAAEHCRHLLLSATLKSRLQIELLHAIGIAGHNFCWHTWPGSTRLLSLRWIVWCFENLRTLNHVL